LAGVSGLCQEILDSFGRDFLQLNEEITMKRIGGFNLSELSAGKEV
jgi:hypothetical protein